MTHTVEDNQIDATDATASALPVLLSDDPAKMMPVTDTVSGSRARQAPAATITHYTHLAQNLWISPTVMDLGAELLNSVGQGRIAWGSLIGPYGFGKTATAITLWQYASHQGFLAIPPLSCTNFDELAHGIASLAEVQAPEHARAIRKLFEQVWAENLQKMAARDATTYQLDSRIMRRILHDKWQAGELAIDDQCHRLVEFLSRLSKLAATWGRGLVVVMDELQQLLGPLDARTIVTFREFVWGVRTEQAPCCVLLCMDTLLEMRLGRWAADLLHRIREQGVLLRLTDVYTQEFPNWLWQQAVQKGALTFDERNALTPEVLIALGQYMERPDLASGPRTVVDVFEHARTQYRHAGRAYDLDDLVEDLGQSRLRYFGEGAPVQRLLLDLLADEWIGADTARQTLVKTLIAFPAGCPESLLRSRFTEETEYHRARADLFGPLLVELSGGLALEGLQRVRRTVLRWEQIITDSWDALPALDVLAVHSPDMIRQLLLPYLFPPGQPGAPQWQLVSERADAAQDGWRMLRGSFSDAYPQRDVAVWVSIEEPADWPAADVCIALVCDSSEKDAVASVASVSAPGRDVLRLPVLRSLEQRVPTELARFRKYVQPEPLRPVTVLMALHELKTALAEAVGTAEREETQEARLKAAHAQAFVDNTLDYLARELLQGEIDVRLKKPLRLAGPELVQGLFAIACRGRYPAYRTLMTTHNWSETLSAYLRALQQADISPSQRQGTAPICGDKATLAMHLFGINSTAAFDSFQKSLGPLLETTGEASAYQITFSRHPAETALQVYFRHLDTREGVPLEAAQETLRHQGYLPFETEKIVTLLEARQVLTRSSSGRLIPINDSLALLAQIQQEAEAIIGFLKMVSTPSIPETLGSESTLVSWQRWRDDLRLLRTKQIQVMLTDRQDREKRLFDLIGLVRSLEVPVVIASGDFHVHLNGIARSLVTTREALLNDQRRQRERLEAIGLPKDAEDVDWAATWHTQREAIRRASEKLELRTEEYKAKHSGLLAWKSLLPQVHAVRVLCERIRQTDSAPLQQFEMLVRQYREKFATEGWQPVQAVATFAECLSPIEAQGQTLLFSQWQAYLNEVSALRRQYGSALSQANCPILEASAPEGGHAALEARFAALYAWAIESFETAFQHCCHEREVGIRWQHPTNRGKPWSQQEREFQEMLETYRQKPDFATVCRVGELVMAMIKGLNNQGRSGTIARLIGTYESPENPPDFQVLQELYAQGLLRLRIERVNQT